MIVLRSKTDYGINISDNTWPGVSVPYIKISRDAIEPSGFLATNNEAGFTHIELDDIPAKVRCNGLSHLVDPGAETTEYTVGHTTIGAEREIMLDSERTDTMPNTAHKQLITGAVLAMAMFLPISSLDYTLQTGMPINIGHKEITGNARNLVEQRQLLEQIDDQVEDDVILAFPAPKKYFVDLIITKITKAKLRLVVPEDDL